MSQKLIQRNENGSSMTQADNGKIYESLALRGDLSALSPEDKTRYYASLCTRLGLDPTTQPFIPLKMNGKEILYASRGCTDQLARIHRVNRQIIKEEELRGTYVVTVEAMLPDGRREQSKGAVNIENLKGDAFCNAIMKAETKAKRRATLSILGLGMLDETEIETIPAYSRTPDRESCTFERSNIHNTLISLNSQLGYNEEGLRKWLAKKYNLLHAKTLDAAFQQLTDAQLSQAIDVYSMQIEKKKAAQQMVNPESAAQQLAEKSQRQQLKALTTELIIGGVSIDEVNEEIASVCAGESDIEQLDGSQLEHAIEALENWPQEEVV